MSYKYSIPKRKIESGEYTVEALYREYQPVMVKLLIMKNHSEADAWDICHNTFENAIVKWDRIEFDRIERFLSRTLYNEAVDYYNEIKKKGFQTGGSDVVELIDEKLLADPIAELTKREFRKTLQAALETLSKLEKEMFYGFYLEDKSIKELRGKKSVGSVVTPLARARSKVSYYFDKNYEKDEV